MKHTALSITVLSRTSAALCSRTAFTSGEGEGEGEGDDFFSSSAVDAAADDDDEEVGCLVKIASNCSQRNTHSRSGALNESSVLQLNNTNSRSANT